LDKISFIIFCQDFVQNMPSDFSIDAQIGAPSIGLTILGNSTVHS